MSMILKGVKVYNCNANYKQLKQIEKRLNTEEIYNNSNIGIKCNIEVKTEPLKNELATILECSVSQICFKYVDEVQKGIDKKKH